MRVLTGILLLAICALAACAVARPAVTPQLYFVPVGELQPGLIDHLVAHFQSKFRITIRHVRAVDLDPTMINRTRRQLSADAAIKAMRLRYPDLADDSGARAIGITAADMYMEAMRLQWTFTFSLRSNDQRFAVVSYARMDPVNFSAPPDDSLLRTRLRKMVMKNIGIMYYGLPASDNPASALYGNILGVDDLDRMTEEFNPR